MGVYSAAVKTAIRLIKAKGRRVTVTHIVLGNEDIEPLADTPTDPDTLTSEIYAVILPPNRMTEQAYADQFANGTLVRSRVRRFMCANTDADGGELAFVIADGDQVTIDGFIWTIVGIALLDPDGSIIMYSGTIKR